MGGSSSKDFLRRLVKFCTVVRAGQHEDEFEIKNSPCALLPLRIPGGSGFDSTASRNNEGEIEIDHFLARLTMEAMTAGLFPESR
jgi:hypothetical protein